MDQRGAGAALPELWGGIECTLNRVGDRFFSQMELSGHLNRPHDLEMIASLGIRTLRYPVLWEMVAPLSLDSPDWSWPDERLSLLRSLGIEPVAGLVHHGSGPRYTSLIDHDFPKKLARYARLVAQRYPWLKSFTPVNEPLTTARFSGLYGHWYPHARDDRVFVRALLQQCRGIAEAMTAIREVIPDARLVVTEDVGMTFSTGLLSYQAEFENHRRWLTFDLLAGRVERDHPMRFWLWQNGASDEDFDFFRSNPLLPEVIGINYYVTSDRYLDEKLDLYPEHLHGGNCRHSYADVEAVRACPTGILGHEEVLRSAWQRYGREVAITEVHLGSSREEQLRWLHEAWQAAVKVRGEGVAVRAVTAWALLGSFDWNTLFTRVDGTYEPGAFDVRGPKPRPTALATAIREIVKGGDFRHEIIGSPGWWHRSQRFLPQFRPAQRHCARCRPGKGRGVVIIGKSGTLGQAFGRMCEQRGMECRLLSRDDMDIASPDSVAEALENSRPWAVINCAGFVRVDDAEEECERCYRENAEGPAVLAAECAARGLAFVTFSSDLVFNGKKGAAYLERDRVAPLNVYGMSKVQAERKVLRLYPRALVVRTSAFFGPWDEYNFVTATLSTVGRGEEVAAASDLVVSPTYLPDLVNAALDLMLDGERGIWHISNRGSVSWAEFAMAFIRLAGLESSAVIPQPAASLGYRALRPAFSALATGRGAQLPDLENALQRYFHDISK